MTKTFVLGVAGGSGSGKTYFARDLYRCLGPEHCALVYQDNFYLDQSEKFDFDGGAVNFDHPSAIDFSLLAKKIDELKSLKVTQIPLYDFATHKRLAETMRVEPKKIILVDGILICHSTEVRELCDKLIYFDTPEQLRFQRRLHRDIKERGRTEEGVRDQFFKQVKPMHDQFVEPSKNFAHQIVRDLGDYEQVLAATLLELKIITDS